MEGGEEEGRKEGTRTRGAGTERCNGGALVEVSASCCSAAAFDADASATAATVLTQYWFISKKERDGVMERERVHTWGGGVRRGAQYYNTNIFCISLVVVPLSDHLLNILFLQ